MGALFTTPGTRAILDTLNTAFDGPGKGLEFIRNVAAPPGSVIRKKIETRNWRAGHLARMLKLRPFDQGGGPVPSDSPGKWWWFLRKMVGPSATFAPIRTALADAILNEDSKGAKLNIVRVSFDHVELEGSANPNVVIFDAPLPGLGGGMVRHITLFTVAIPKDATDTEPNLEPDEADFDRTLPWDTSSGPAKKR